MQGQIKITSNVSEQQLIECLLNMKHSGWDENRIMIMLSLYALAKSWYFNKIIYYINLLELRK